MARTPTEIREDLAEVAVKIRSIALGNVPVKGTIGRTTIDLSENLKALYQLRRDLRSELAAALRAAGVIGFRRREIF
jgi:hypothetical protein